MGDMYRVPFAQKELYGGAITVEIPSTFYDVSNLRQVPDHQEVFLDRNGFTSIIFEITERVGPAGGGPVEDSIAVKTHINEISDSKEDILRVWNTTETKFSKLPEGTPAYTLLATQTPFHDPKPGKPDFTAIVFSLLRLEKEKTDFLVTINVPHIKGEYADEVDINAGKNGRLIDDAVNFATKVWETFHVVDWGLFKSV